MCLKKQEIRAKSKNQNKYPETYPKNVNRRITCRKCTVSILEIVTKLKSKGPSTVSKFQKVEKCF